MRLGALAWLGLLLLVVPLPSAGAEEDSGSKSSESDARSILRRGGLAPTFSLHGFADTTFVAERVESAGEDSTQAGFFVGELDLYMVSRLTERFSFLGEAVFEFEEGGETRADVERVFVKYAHSDLLWVSLGRRHTPLGYWNETYHHGLFLQPSVERPFVLRFEDKAGVLPIHSVGLDVGGTAFRGPWSLEYRGGLYNGRGAEREVVQTLGDANVNKAAVLKASALRERAGHRVRFGATVYRDEIPPRAVDPGSHGEIDERTYGFHLLYERKQIEILGEYYDIYHRETDLGQTFGHQGYYAIAVWQPWKWKPYVGYDALDLSEGDPYYAGIAPYQRRYLAGVRFDAIPFLALKCEFRHDELNESKADGVAVQVAYTF